MGQPSWFWLLLENRGLRALPVAAQPGADSVELAPASRRPAEPDDFGLYPDLADAIALDGGSDPLDG